MQLQALLAEVQGLRDLARSLWHKAGERLPSEPSALRDLSWNNKGLDSHDFVYLSQLLASGALQNLTSLRLGCNSIGNVGVSALVSACANGALPYLKELALSFNQIGDPGITSLSEALAVGAMAQLEALWLTNNRIGDAGLVALSDALRKGALQKLELLVVDDGPLGTEHPALKAACESRGISLE